MRTLRLLLTILLITADANYVTIITAILIIGEQYDRFNPPIVSTYLLSVYPQLQFVEGVML
jgi:hypothetical protein